MRIEFQVHGRPVPQGSKRAFPHRTTHKVMMLESSNGLKPWRERISMMAAVAMREAGLCSEPFKGPVRVHARFSFERPKSHLRKDGTVKNTAPIAPSDRANGDADKLLRAALDAMTGIVYGDDSQVVWVCAEKAWGEEPGMGVTVEEIE